MSAAASIQALTDWKKDAYEPAQKYLFLLNGKPYRGAFNKKYVGKQITYYTGVKPSRYSQQLEFVPKGFEVEDEKVETMLDKWVKQELRFDPFINKVPIYGSNLGVADEAIRPPVLGYQIVRTDPNTGERNALATYYDNQLTRMVQPTRRPNLTVERTDIFFPLPMNTPAQQPPETPLSQRSQTQARLSSAYSPYVQTPISSLAGPSQLPEQSIPLPVAPVQTTTSRKAPATPPPAYVEPEPAKLPPEYAGVPRSLRQIQGDRVDDFLKKNKDDVVSFFQSLPNVGRDSFFKEVSARYNLSQRRTKDFFDNNPAFVKK